MRLKCLLMAEMLFFIVMAPNAAYAKGFSSSRSFGSHSYSSRSYSSPSRSSHSFSFKRTTTKPHISKSPRARTVTHKSTTHTTVVHNHYHSSNGGFFTGYIMGSFFHPFGGYYYNSAGVYVHHPASVESIILDILCAIVLLTLISVIVALILV